MKALATRIDRLYQTEVERWHAAWHRFEIDLWRPTQEDERQAWRDLWATKGDAALHGRVNLITEAWEREAWGPGVEFNNDKSPYAVFFDAFNDGVPWDLETPDLSRWPEYLPQAPPDNGIEAGLWELSRRDKGNSEDERLAAGWVFLNLAARIYSRAAH